jgi:anti-sigma28 factor (negative regulator of flagellin synthesis)
MKIDSNSSGLDHAAPQRLEKPAADAPKPAAAGKTVSGDAELANEAVKAANDLPEIRTDLVERMRVLLAAGELGNDAGLLADSLIDNMLDKTSDTDKK